MMMMSTTRMPAQMPITPVIGMPGGSGKLGVSEGDELRSVEVGDVLDWLLEVEVLLDGFVDRLGVGLAGLLADEEVDDSGYVAVDTGLVENSWSVSGDSGSGVALGTVFEGSFEGDEGCGWAT